MSSFSLYECLQKTSTFRRYVSAFKLPILLIFTLIVTVTLYKMNREIPLDPRYHILNDLPSCQLDQDVRRPYRVDLPKVLAEFQKCIEPIVKTWRNHTDAVQLMNEQFENTAQCDEIFWELELSEVTNNDETKSVILPTCKEDNILVTMGIGRDTLAEEKLNKLLPSTKFYGADPIINTNRELYSRFGRYFPFAMGKKAGTSTFFVLDGTYQYEEVITIPMAYFLSDILALKKIDMIWMDIEGGELEILDQLHRGEELDKKGVTICQINVEIHFHHFPKRAIAFHDFMFRVLAEQRYVFMKPSRPSLKVHRLFLVNVENKECLRKFIL